MDEPRSLEGPRICLFGASLDTGNLGVSALASSVLAAVARRRPDARVTVFDHGREPRAGALVVDGRSFAFVQRGGRNSLRLHRPESLWTMRAAGWLGGLGNAGARAVAESDLVLDASGGDSFTDLYGSKRFRGVTLPKRIALERGVPLVLLPQTYGPFAAARRRRVAVAVVLRASQAWAREARSFEALRELAGAGFDPRRHRLGVDVAFTLPARPPRALPEPLASWLAPSPDARPFPLAVLNPSGLLYHDAPGAAERFRLRADYRALLAGLLDALLAAPGARVVLLPHVLAPPGHPESDPEACARLLDAVPARLRPRVAHVDAPLEAGEAKWIASRGDWTCATRMHAGIASLSSGVPAAVLAYSDKARGVLESCGAGDGLVDLRALGTSAALQLALESWRRRAESRPYLERRACEVADLAERELDRILALARPRAASEAAA